MACIERTTNQILTPPTECFFATGHSSKTVTGLIQLNFSTFGLSGKDRQVEIKPSNWPLFHSVHLLGSTRGQTAAAAGLAEVEPRASGELQNVRKVSDSLPKAPKWTRGAAKRGKKHNWRCCRASEKPEQNKRGLRSGCSEQKKGRYCTRQAALWFLGAVDDAATNDHLRSTRFKCLIHNSVPFPSDTRGSQTVFQEAQFSFPPEVHLNIPALVSTACSDKWSRPRCE